MLRDALNLERVRLADEATPWPAPLSLAVALNEMLLIEGADPATGEALLDVAATLRAPAAGSLRHWDREAAALPREDLYDLRRRIAYISPRQVLLHRLTLAENIALGPCYHEGVSETEALAAAGDLLEHLKLTAHLNRLPVEVSGAVYARAVWARELAKGPELILAVMAGPLNTPDGAAMLLMVLQDYLAGRGAAAVLVGESLEPFYPLGQRLLVLTSGQLHKRTLLEHRARPLTAYLPLV
jgi:ABC-type methionine transport system ATPase subunit